MDVERSGAARAVFLSYASQDADAARKICDALRGAGVEVWFDQSELRGGDAWDALIRKRIKECALFVPIISTNTQARGEGYFRLEWKLAVDRSHLMSEDTAFLFPVVIDDVPDATARVPDKFREVQWTRLRLDETPTELAARVARLLQGNVGTSSHESSPRPAAEASRDPGSPEKSKPSWVRHAYAAVGLLFALVFMLRPMWHQPTKAAPPPPVAPAIPAPSPISQLPSPSSPPAADSKSVAVLAFANLSEDKDNEYFSDGISEELLNVLQKIPGLHVAARTSAFSFKGKSATAQEIGQKLGVANIVEGSVQKSGTRVKVTAHLSRAATGEELWSESYTRELKDVFALQSELALAIVGELRGQLGGGDNTAVVKAAVKGGTTNAEAYQQYLQGRYFSGRHSEKDIVEGLAYYQRAVGLDPAFALAWAGLGKDHIWLCNFSSNMNRAEFDDHLARAREAVDRALTLEPSLPEALLGRCVIQLNFDYNWKGAGESLRTALALAPSDPELLIAAGNLAGALGDMERSTGLFRQAVALDPVNATARVFFAFTLAVTGHLAEAKVEFPRVVELSPSAPWAHAGLGLGYLFDGQYEAAAVAAQDDAAEWARLVVVAPARFAQGRMPEADAALARLVAAYADTAAYQVAEVYAYRNEKDRAFDWLERAHRQRDGGLIDVRKDPFLANLRSDPRWPEFLRKIGLADDQLK